MRFDFRGKFKEGRYMYAVGLFDNRTITGEQQEVKFSAVAIDDRSCAGAEPEYNSGAMTMQFFVGQCEGSVGGCVDIVWVIDGSGSMGDLNHANELVELIREHFG